jgi:hypothetical protein
MSAASLEKLITKVSEAPHLVAYAETKFSGNEAQMAGHLLSEADESPFPIQQWVAALYEFDQWLLARGLTLPIKNQIGYVSCSAEVGSAYATMTQLPLQLIEMLEIYGCDEACASH